MVIFNSYVKLPEGTHKYDLPLIHLDFYKCVLSPVVRGLALRAIPGAPGVGTGVPGQAPPGRGREEGAGDEIHGEIIQIYRDL